MAEEAWRRWGEDDQRGALNLIGEAEVLAAAGLVKTGRIIPLSQPISSTMLVPPARSRPSLFMSRDGGDYAAGARKTGGFQFADDTIVMPLHIGTHLDCLCHAWYDDTLYNGHSGNTVRSNGALRCGAETLGGIISRGVLLDFVALNGAPLADGDIIGAEMVEAALKQAGTTLSKGDIVLLRTGWFERNEGNRTADFNREPGINVEAALLLAKADVAVVGADNYAVEVLPFPEGTIFPVHQRLMRDYGIPLLEGLSLKALGEVGAKTFLFMASALPIVGATASPLAPVAVL